MKQHINFITLVKKVSLIVFFVLALPHCTSVPTNNPQQSNSPNDLLQQAELASTQNNHAEAAELYKKLASNTPSNKDVFLAKAIDAYRQAGDFSGAERLIASLTQASATTSLSHAKLLLEQGKTEEAGRVLDSLDKNSLDNEQIIDLHTQRSSAFFQSGNLFESARERAFLDLLPQQADARLANQNRLIETLLLLSSQALTTLTPPPSDPMASWIELSIALKSSQSNINNPAITLWQQQHPSHNANNSFLPNYLEENSSAYKTSEKVAVFLPSSGPYAKSAQSIRQGIMSAAYTLMNQWQPDITFYDTANAPITTLYQQAISDGMSSIIGPLDKKNVSQLHQLNEHSVPVIALNKIEGQAPSNTNSLSLNPEDDVLQIASLAWLKGHQRALILTPQTAFGQRIAEHFANVWQQFGGSVNGVQTFTPKKADYSIAIKGLLGLDESISRFKQLRNRLNLTVEFNERRRHDVDFIFLIASPRDGRLIKPQLRFHRATTLPVFSTSKIYSGNHNSIANSDLDGVYFCDAPSLIEPSTHNGIDTVSLLNRWGTVNGSSKRLFSLGIDAYQAIPHINRLKNSTFARLNGTSGILSIDQSGKINRQLTCATFKKGQLKSLGLAPHLEKTDFFQAPENNPSTSGSSRAIPL